VTYDLLYSGDVTTEGFQDAVESNLFDDEASWLAYLGTITLVGTVADVDFSTHQVATGFVRVTNTCGLSIEGTTVTQASGEPVHVDVTVADSSGGCDTACSMVGEVLVAVAIDRGSSTATICTRRSDEGC